MELAREIALGKFDDELDVLADAIHERHKIVRKTQQQVALATLTPGTKVRMTDRISPKYLQGATGQVTGKKGSRLLIRLDETHGRFSSESDLRCPADLVEVIA